MNSDRLTLLAAIGELSIFERAVMFLRLCLSANARKRYSEYRRVSDMLALSLADPDDYITFRIEAKRRVLRVPKPATLLLISLGIIIVLEWGTYTLPRLYDITKEFVHSCGLR